MRSSLNVRVPQFEGPLDLLLHLIQTHELEISKLAVSKITQPYLDYVRHMQDQAREETFEIATEFLVLAATLILWKSRALLPQEATAAEAADGAEVPLTPEDLVRQLMEHQKFLALGQQLGERNRLGEDTFTRPNGRPPVAHVFQEMSMTGLSLNYQTLIANARKRTQVLKKETVSMGTKIEHFAARLKLGELVNLRELILIHSKDEEVVSFLATLELTRLKKTRVFQQSVYGDIYVELLENLSTLDFGLVQGFESSLQEQVA